MEKLYIGIDSGGTHSKICVINEKNVILRKDRTGSLNMVGNSREQVIESCDKILTLVKNLEEEGTSRVEAVCIGAAGGVDSRNFVKNYFHQKGLKNVQIVADFEIAYKGNLEDEDGILLISGTGSVCIGKTDGQYIRAGGYGYLYSDEGSGYSIGNKMIRWILKSHDGRAEKTLLEPLVYEALSVNDFDAFLAHVLDPEREKWEIAALTKTLVIALEKQDTAAIHILNEAAAELMELIQAVKNRMKRDAVRICLHGGVFDYTDELVHQLKERVEERKDGSSVHNNRIDCAYTAALLSRQL